MAFILGEISCTTVVLALGVRSTKKDEKEGREFCAKWS